MITISEAEYERLLRKDRLSENIRWMVLREDASNYSIIGEKLLDILTLWDEDWE